LIRIESGLIFRCWARGRRRRFYNQGVGEQLGCPTILPEHAGLASVIATVVECVTIRRSGLVTSPAKGEYRVHFETGLEDHSNVDAAMQALQTALKQDAQPRPSPSEQRIFAPMPRAIFEGRRLRGARFSYRPK
jgi:hypothetical protein